ncbi:hypothetical protein AB0M80_32780 [Amycolatopsis sp. NPDC051045]|uniref:hypothetical protein n=1 Tax=Amycolatopsis sp. NPDC051045 TaxID=3156922 RepID=UPI00342B82C8
MTIACERSVPGIRTALIAGLSSGPGRIRAIAATNAMGAAYLLTGIGLPLAGRWALTDASRRTSVGVETATTS